MQAEVLSVGTELLLGQTVNTDTTIVAKALSMLGIDLLYAAVVGDNVKRLEKAVHDALERSDILITTGGLGPTGDDLTKETVAAAAGKALALHEPSYKRLMEYFARGGLSENQIKQAMLPEGCTVLQNDNGTAPGCAFQTAAGKLVVMLPGPPSELEPMLQNYAVPYLAQFQSAVIASHSVHVFGRGEAAVAEMIADLTENSNPTAAPYAKEGEMFVRVTAKAATQAEADALCAPVVEEIRRRVGSFVYSVDVDSLEALVVDALRAAGKTLATAESCTGGLLAKRITDVAGSSDVFEMGCVTYANRVKEKLLGVPHETLEAHGAVSEETARAMAEGIVRASGANIGVGITGIAGPGGGTAEKPVGLVYIALSDGKSTWVAKRQPAGRMKSREWHRHCAASKALDMVRRYLAGLPVDEA
ncbi:MAG: competence/damage-inducible protein A [Acutalibacteraceae bacterium]